MRVLLSVMFASLLIAGVVSGGDIEVKPSTQKTSKDTGLELEIENIDLSGRRVRVQGTVTNTGDKSYDIVSIVLSMKDAAGKLIVRDKSYTDPMEIAPGEVGYLDTRIDPKGKVPVTIEYSVLGDL